MVPNGAGLGSIGVMPERTTPVPRSSRLPRLSMPELWACLAVLLPVLGAIVATISTVDLAYQLRAGAIILDTRVLPSPDQFTFTAAGLPWLDQQWGAQAALAAIYRVGGWALLAVVRAALVGLMAWFVYRGCRSAGAGIRVAAWLTLAGFGVGLVALGLRPQLLGMVLFAATLAILAGRDRHPRLIWAIPILTLLWANSHGSFFLGPAAVAIAGLERSGRAAPLGAHDLPGGRRLYGGHARRPVWPGCVGLCGRDRCRSDHPAAHQRMAADVPAVVRRRDVLRIDRRRSCAGRSCHQARFGRSGSFRAVPPARLADIDLAGRSGRDRRVRRAGRRVVVDRGTDRPRRSAPTRRDRPGRDGIGGSRSEPRTEPAPADRTTPATGSLVPTAMVVLLIVVVVVILPVWRGGDRLYGPSGLLTDAPRGLTTAILAEAHAGDRIWNAQEWGSWLEFATPGAPVAVDSRIELMPSDAWADHQAISSGAPDWEAILARRGVHDRRRVRRRAARADPAHARLVRVAPDRRRSGRRRLRSGGSTVTADRTMSLDPGGLRCGPRPAAPLLSFRPGTGRVPTRPLDRVAAPARGVPDSLERA